MASLRIKRGVRAAFDAIKTALGIKESELYHITDENRVELGTGTSTSVALALVTDVTAERSATALLTNKTISLSNNTVTGTLAQFNAAVTDADLVSLAGSETLTNKTLTNPTINGFTADTSAINIGGGQIVKDASGNVGVGVANSGGYGGAKFATLGGMSMVNPGSKLHLYYVSATSRAWIGSEASGDVTIGTGTSSPAERMRISPAGNTLLTAGSNQFQIGTADTKKRAQFNFDGVANLFSIGVEDGYSVTPMAFRVNGQERMRIAADGLIAVGLGQTAAYPPISLHLAETGHATSKRTGMSIGARWLLAQDYVGDGTKDLFIYDSVAARLVLRSDTSGNTTFNAGAFGYGAGAGGAVTQATSKATGVTLNKPSGMVTSHNAALAANTTIAFTVTNSFCAVTDTVSLNVAGGTGDVAAYLVYAFPYAGGFYITIWNRSGGSLSDAVQIKFNVIKGSNT